MSGKEFASWYASHLDEIRVCLNSSPFGYDEDLASEAFIRVLNAIERRRAIINNPKGYYTTTYRNIAIQSAAERRTTILDDYQLNLLTETPYTNDDEERQNAVNALYDKIREYVRLNYDDKSITLFELYIQLLPDATYRKLAEMLQIPFYEVWQNLGRIRKDVAQKFRKEADNLLLL